MGDLPTDLTDRDPPQRVPGFSCPRCGSAVPAGATRCQSCAGRAPADQDAALAQPAVPGPDLRKVAAVGCIVVMLTLAVFTIAAVAVVGKLRDASLRAAKREQQRMIDEERRQYESEQAQRSHGTTHIAEPVGELAVLAGGLHDLEGHEVHASTTLEHGGVVIVYPMGCPDCTSKLASAERCANVARSHNLGVQVIVIRGTVEGVALDKLPDSLRAVTLLDADGKVGAALNVGHLTAIVVDSDGSSVVCKVSPEEAVGMIPSVAQGE